MITMLTKDLFISYGRRESLGLVGRLHQQLKLAGYDAWFDKVNIPDSEDYAERINHGIETAHNFVYVMAPRCLTSPYCLIELEYARILGKRVIPINQMVIFQTDSRELSAADQAVLHGFYALHRVPDQNINTTQAVLERSLALIGRTDWLDAKEHLADEDCAKLATWAQGYENYWHKHDDIEYLNTFEFPVFGHSTDSLKSIVERMQLVLERHKPYVQKHTEILLATFTWQRNQRLTRYLLVGKERSQAEDWLLTEFIEGEQQPCQPTDLQCEFICESRKNSSNLMTHAFICYDVADQTIRNEVVRLLARQAITTWRHDQDIHEGTNFTRAIEVGIETADNFLYFLSPASIQSSYCQQELEHALRYHKRIIPLLISPMPLANIPESIRNLQYLNFTHGIQLDPLLKILRHDQAYYEQHKVLLARALQWQQAHQQPAFLLRGHNLNNALIWLRLNKDRLEHPPTEHHQALITASEAAKGQLGTEVFISYSRKDSDFARQLNLALQAAGKTTWFDQESISSGVDFEREIFKGIEGANNFVLIISPDAVESPYCEREVNYASTQCKRFIPILWRPTMPATLPQVLRIINWIDFQSTPFEEAFPELIQTLDLDREHAHQHTVLQQRATEWQINQYSNDFLLNLNACNNAEQWLTAAQDDNKQPVPTIIQQQYIQKSRAVINKVQRAAKIRFAFMSALATVALILAIVAFIQMRNAKDAQATAEKETLRTESLFLASRAESLIEKHQSLEAITVALQGLPKPYSEPENFSRPYVGEAAVALNKALRETPKSILLEGHQAPVRNAVFSPDGKRVATASEDKTVRIWDSQTGEPLLVIQGHLDKVSGVDFEPTQGQRLVTSSKDRTARIWDSQSGKQLLVLNGHDDEVNFVAFSPDGQRIVTASEDKTARIWDSQTGQPLQVLSGHKDHIYTAIFSPDGRYVLTASGDRTVRIWDSQNGKEIRSLKHESVVSSAVFSPDGFQLVTASKDGTVRILDSQSGKSLKVLQGHEDNVMFARFSLDNHLLATVSTDGTVRIWDSQSGKQLYILQGHKGTVASVYFSSDGQHLVTASYDNTARIWTLQNSKQFLELFRHNDVINGIAFSPNGDYLATASSDRTVRMWDRQNGKQLLILKGHDDWVKTVQFSPDGHYLVTASGDKTARIWDSHSGKQLQQFKHQEWVYDAVFSNNGQQVATASDTVRIWDSQNGKLILELPKHNGASVRSIKYSPDGQRLLAAFTDKTARLWNSQNGKQLLVLEHPSPISAAIFSPDSRFIGTTSYNGNTYIWDSHSGKQYSTLEGHTATVWGVDFSPNNQYIATASNDGTVRIWDSHSGKQFALLLEGVANYTTVFSPSGQRIATGSADGIARIYSLPPPLPELINNTWESFWYVFTPQQRETLLLYLFNINKDTWKNLVSLDKPESTSQKRLDYLWNTIWQPLTSKAKEKLSIYLLRLAWREVSWEKVTLPQFKQLSNCLNRSWQDRSPQYFNLALLFALEKEWPVLSFSQQENVIKSVSSLVHKACRRPAD